MALNLDYVARETANNLRRNFTLTVAALLTVVVALLLLGISLLVRQGATNASGRFRGDIELLVFMEPQATQAQIDAVGQHLDDNPEVKSQEFVDQNQAFEDAKRLFADEPDLLQIITPDILPTSFKVVPVNPDVQAVVALGEVYTQQPGVRRVVSAEGTIRAIQKITQRISFVVLLAAVFSLCAALLLIYNTIRTAMFARRREIEVMKLVGATNWFIRVPFILEGLIQGIVGGAMSAGLLMLANRLLSTQLTESIETQFLENFVVSSADALRSGMVLLVLGAVIGSLASGFAAGRFLDV